MAGHMHAPPPNVTSVQDACQAFAEGNNTLVVLRTGAEAATTD